MPAPPLSGRVADVAPAAASARRSDTVLLIPRMEAPYSHIVGAWASDEAPPRVIAWLEGGDAGAGRTLSLQRPRAALDYSTDVQYVSPRLLLHLLRCQADVVVVLEMGIAGLYAVLSKLRHPGRRVLCLIEAPQDRLGATGRAWWRSAYRRWLGRWVDGFLANSASAAHYLHTRLGVPSRRVHEGWWLAGMPARDAVTHPDPAPGGPLGLLYVGGLVGRKGVDLLLRAVAEVPDGTVDLRVVGDGPERPALERLADRLDVADRVTFTGAQDHAAVRDEMSRCRVLVLPSLNEYVGRVVVEALSLGRPVIVSESGGAATSIVSHGENGLVVDTTDAGAFGRALQQLATTRELDRVTAGARRSAEGLDPASAARVLRAAVDSVRRSSRASS